MTKSGYRPSLSCLALLAALLLGGAQPALAAGERWFQVELIAFARAWDDSGEEQWPLNIELAYPAHWVELKTPEALLRARQEAEVAQRARRDPLSYPVPWITDDTPIPEVVPVDLRREAFVLLPADERALNRHATAINRSNQYRVLLHQAWRQPMLADDQAPWILIGAGDEYGPHRELEGSIQLSVGRFLHLETRLWLAAFEYSQGPGAWPNPPLRPTREIDSATPAPRRTRSQAGEHTGERDPRTGLPYPEQREQRYGDYFASPYRARHVATLNQRRRMRSNELHYIDHPLMGLLLRITPYEPPPPQESTAPQRDAADAAVNSGE